MIDDTFRLIWTDALVTLMLGAILILQLLSGDKYRGRLDEARQMAEQWKARRQAMAASARRLIRRVCYGIFVVGVSGLFVGTIFEKQLKALNPPHTILVSEIAMIVLALCGLALYFALINSGER
jgi:hypothetical protein